MNPLIFGQTLQSIAWFIVISQVIIAFYTLFSDPKGNINRYLCFFLLVLSANSFTIVWRADSVMASQAQATLPALLLSATAPILPLIRFLLILALLKPHVFRGRWKFALGLTNALLFLPAVLTFVDYVFHTRLLDPGSQGFFIGSGLPEISTITNGVLSSAIISISSYLITAGSVLVVLHTSLLDKNAVRVVRQMSHLILAAMALVLATQFTLQATVGSQIFAITSNVIYVAVFLFAAYRVVRAQRRLVKGSLQMRLVALIMAVSLPIFIGVAIVIISVADGLIGQYAAEDLKNTNYALLSETEVWLDFNIRSLQQLVSHPDIISMDPERQRPLLQNMANTYPHMYLISTTDMSGINVARNDDEDPKDYSDRYWFQEAGAGSELVFQTLIGRTSGVPSFIVSMPIKNEMGEILGVGMFATQLDALSRQIHVHKIGNTGYAFIVDENNRVIGHPDPSYTQDLRDLSDSPPVAAMRKGQRGAMSYADEAGIIWDAYVEEMALGWGVIVQQQQEEAMQGSRQQRLYSLFIISAGSIFLFVMVWVVTYQAIRPISVLIDTVSSITTGDVTKRVEIKRDDEIGLLATTFNNMTNRLHSLIEELEQRVAERTENLEHQALLLQASTEVSRAASSVLESEELIQKVVDLIRQRFDLYYVGLFLKDRTNEWALLHAGTGEAGQRMVSRGHRIKIGEGMVGWSIASGEMRVALEVGGDTVQLATSELPETRSEAAIPLRSRGVVLGALSVQSEKPGAFDQMILDILQSMADQVAVALDNASLFSDIQQSLEATNKAYAKFSLEEWYGLLSERKDWGYRYAARSGMISRPVTPVRGEWKPEMLEAVRTGLIVQKTKTEGNVLVIPLKMRGQIIGAFHFSKEAGASAWIEEEIHTLETLVEQLGLALENARLYEATQRRAERERLIGELTTHIRETLDIETVLKTGVREMRKALNLKEVEVRIGTGFRPHDNGDREEQDLTHLQQDENEGQPDQSEQ